MTARHIMNFVTTFFQKLYSVLRTSTTTLSVMPKYLTANIILKTTDALSSFRTKINELLHLDVYGNNVLINKDRKIKLLAAVPRSRSMPQPMRKLLRLTT